MNDKYVKSLICLTICSFTYITLMWYWKVEPMKIMYVIIPSPDRYVDTEGCVIPFYDPFDESVMPFYTKPRVWDCSTKVPLTYQYDLLLKLDNRSVSYCTSQTLLRASNNDDKFSFSKITNFTESYHVSSEFIRVRCFDKKGARLFSNLHAFTPRNLTREKHLSDLLTQHKHRNKPEEILNVLFIGIDSLSRSNHIRLMPKTRQFLLGNLSAVDLQGYNKVEHNTYVNMTPLLTGNFVKDENKKQGITDPKGPFDKYNIIWKNFSSHGYTTMMAEDAPSMAIFNYQKRGFATPPTHHYLRPFSLAITQESGVSWKSSSCVQNRTETKVVLDYTYDFVKTYREKPYFAWSFISRITHDDVKNAAYIDEEYLQFLKRIKKEGLLNNTILFFMSDHGLNYGDISKTVIGQIEVRMPLMNIVFPSWFKPKYPEIHRNVVDNVNKLTTPFDIHETLQDILYFTGKPREMVNTKKRGLSLFDAIPGSRNCFDASIPPHYCVCKSEEVKLEDELRKDSIKFLVEHINLKITNHSMCVKREVKHVRYIKGYKTSKNSAQIFIKSFFTLTPENAEFEATLKYDSKFGLRLAGSISRVNKYGRTADCIDLSNLRPFCYCRNNIKTTKRPKNTTSKPHH